MDDTPQVALTTPLTFVLPFPPSVNRYYRHVGPRTLLSREGRVYRELVCTLLAGRVPEPIEGPLEVHLDLFPPDARRRDWDNFQKGVWDSLQHAGVYHDDSQIKRAVIEMFPPSRSPRAEVALAPYVSTMKEPNACPASFMNMSSMNPCAIPMTPARCPTNSSRSRLPKGRKKPARRTKRVT